MHTHIHNEKNSAKKLTRILVYNLNLLQFAFISTMLKLADISTNIHIYHVYIVYKT